MCNTDWYCSNEVVPFRNMTQNIHTYGSAGSPEHEGEGGSTPPVLEERGQGGKVFFLCCLLISFFHIFFLPSFSLRLDTPLPFRFHNLPRNATMVGSICLWKVTLNFKFWRHYDVIIIASALSQTSAPPVLLLFWRSCAGVYTFCNNYFDAPSKPLIQSLGLKTIEELINRQVNLTVFKRLNSIAPKHLCDIFTKNTVNATRSLRYTNTDLRLPLKSSANGQKCFSFRGAKC